MFRSMRNFLKANIPRKVDKVIELQRVANANVPRIEHMVNVEEAIGEIQAGPADAVASIRGSSCCRCADEEAAATSAAAAKKRRNA